MSLFKNGLFPSLPLAIKNLQLRAFTTQTNAQSGKPPVTLETILTDDTVCRQTSASELLSLYHK